MTFINYLNNLIRAGIGAVSKRMCSIVSYCDLLFIKSNQHYMLIAQ